MPKKKEAGYNYNVAPITPAMNTLGRIEVLLAERKQPDETLISGPTEVNAVDLPASYSEVINAELKVLRAQLYKTGFFKLIECNTL